MSRDIVSLRATADEGSFWPTKLSIASTSSRRFCVKSCDARSEPARRRRRRPDRRGRASRARSGARGCARSGCAAAPRDSRRARSRYSRPSSTCLLTATSGSIGSASGAEVQRLARPRVRNIDHAEGLHLLRLAVLEHLEVFLLQPANEVAVPVDDAHVFFDVVHLDLEGDFRRGRRLGARRARSPARDRPRRSSPAYEPDAALAGPGPSTFVLLVYLHYKQTIPGTLASKLMGTAILIFPNPICRLTLPLSSSR